MKGSITTASSMRLPDRPPISVFGDARQRRQAVVVFISSPPIKVSAKKKGLHPMSLACELFLAAKRYDQVVPSSGSRPLYPGPLRLIVNSRHAATDGLTSPGLRDERSIPGPEPSPVLSDRDPQANRTTASVWRTSTNPSDCRLPGLRNGTLLAKPTSVGHILRNAAS